MGAASFFAAAGAAFSSTGAAFLGADSFFAAAGAAFSSTGAAFLGADSFFAAAGAAFSSTEVAFLGAASFFTVAGAAFSSTGADSFFTVAGAAFSATGGVAFLGVGFLFAESAFFRVIACRPFLNLCLWERCRPHGFRSGVIREEPACRFLACALVAGPLPGISLPIL